tara:strand:+ start:852 stop:968 length:117 start_codon:yes stop_codon:yes gene_type:complete
MSDLDLSDEGLKEIIREMLYYDVSIKAFRIKQLCGLEN